MATAALLTNLFGHPGTSMNLPEPEILEDVFWQMAFPQSYISACSLPERQETQSEQFHRNQRSCKLQGEGPSSIIRQRQKENFEVNLNVNHFKPEEIIVRLDTNNVVIVDAKHEERKDESGSVSRHFVRQYDIPEGHDVSKLESKLSPEGILTITAPKIGPVRRNAGVITIPVLRGEDVEETREKKSEEGDDEACFQIFQ